MERDDEIEQDYLSGKCFALAYAMHQRFGWPIEGKVERYADGAEYFAHVWVVGPNGQAFDAQGFSDRDALAASFGTAQGRLAAFEPDEFLAFCEVDEDDEFDDFFSDVDEAAEAIAVYFMPRHLQPAGVLTGVRRNAMGR